MPPVSPAGLFSQSLCLITSLLHGATLPWHPIPLPLWLLVSMPSVSAVGVMAKRGARCDSCGALTPRWVQGETLIPYPESRGRRGHPGFHMLIAHSPGHAPRSTDPHAARHSIPGDGMPVLPVGCVASQRSPVSPSPPLPPGISNAGAGDTRWDIGLFPISPWLPPSSHEKKAKGSVMAQSVLPGHPVVKNLPCGAGDMCSDPRAEN